MRLFIPFLLSLLIACQPAQPPKAPETSQLGDLGHDFTISEAARPYFDKGLLLLHSFEYEDARDEFEKARKADGNELMAYWGLAMTHYKALWGLQDVVAGREVMGLLGDNEEERLSKAENELEADFWTGIEILYGDGELAERNKKYVKHMARVYGANPGNLEVAAFYSLGLMWADYKDQENLNLSSQVAAGIVKENPTHPGALHYMIHANDNPDFAKVAIEAANSYAKVAPDAAHALHMPSHIYVALGMWKEVVSSNDDSYNASVNRMKEKGLSGRARGYHSLAWLHYGYLQLGQYEKAADLLRQMIEFHGESTADESYLIMMQNQQRIESGEWPESLEFQDVSDPAIKVGMEGKAKIHFLRSLFAYDRKDLTGVETQIEGLKAHLAAAKLIVTDDGVALCSAGPTRYAPDEESIKRTQVVIYQMEAMAAMLREEDDGEESKLKMAVALEEEVGYDSGPPFIAYPSFEQYGDWLLIQNRPEEALEQFEKSLSSRTNRTKALLGKLKALEALGRSAEVEEVKDLLLKLEVRLS